MSVEVPGIRIQRSKQLFCTFEVTGIGIQRNKQLFGTSEVTGIRIQHGDWEGRPREARPRELLKFRLFDSR